MERREILCDSCGRLVNYRENFGKRLVINEIDHDFCPPCYRKFFEPILTAFTEQRVIHKVPYPR